MQKYISLTEKKIVKGRREKKKKTKEEKARNVGVSLSRLQLDIRLVRHHQLKRSRRQDWQD